MPENALVLIVYGPYEACGLVEHRTSRLQGMKTVLEKDGHTVEFEAMDDRNLVELYVNREKIYNCDIRELQYKSDGELDDLCQEALNCVRKAF